MEELTLKGVCAKKVRVNFENNVLTSVEFIGGCKGNLSFISKMLIGKTREEIISLCENNLCGNKSTSCMDQFAKVLKK